jgi:hypothetical protein
VKAYFVVADARLYANVLAEISSRATIEQLVSPPARIGSSKLGTIARLALHESRDVFRLLPLALRNSKHKTVFVCSTSHYAALLSARLASVFGARTEVFLFNFYLHELGALAPVRLVLKTLLSGRVGLVVQSPNEVDYYSRLAPTATVEYQPLGFAPIAASGIGVKTEDYVFSGGYTNRDYDLYVAAAELLYPLPFVLACATANRLPAALPANLRIIRDCSSTEFYRTMGAARLVVLPLKKDVGSSGQMVALAAMQLAKCVIYTDIPVVGQYFSDGQTGIACPIGDLDRLVALIARWYPDEAGAERIGRAACVAANQTCSADSFEAAVARHASNFMAGEQR